MTRKCLTVLTVLLLGSVCLAQTATRPAGDIGRWSEWPRATGDWGGARTALEDKGIRLDWGITQIVQENMHGGASTNGAIKYSGSNDLELTLDTGKMGLWKGGTFVLKADTRWGHGVNSQVGSLMPVNLDALLPSSDESCVMTLSEFFYQQVLLDGKLVFVIGKLWGARAFDTNEFANDETTQFMNAALRNYPMIPNFLPYTTMGVAGIVNPTDWLSILTGVADTDGSATRTGFDTAFHGETNTTVIHEWDFTWKPFNQVGHQRIGMVTSCKNMPRLSNPASATDCNLAVYYNFDQYLWTESEDSKQGVGVFGRFGWADKRVNPVDYFYSLGLGGKGVIPTRDRDTCGLGWYFGDASNQLQAPVSQESGIEMYYSIEVLPWLHISPDFQIICDPGGNRDTALVGGIRFQMDL
jgi:porin